MEDVVENPFEGLALPAGARTEVRGKILCVAKWNWDYEDCLAFQKRAQEFVRLNRSFKVYIFCNHPHVFTLGRGNERGEAGLVDFEDSPALSLRYPVQKIHRGGGITFHYPGQWIFYPIVSIGPSYSLSDHMCWLLSQVKTVLEKDFKIEGVMSAKKLMGVWKDRKKLASIGVGVSRFVSEHGIALNVVKDKEMFEELQKINPCGMSHETYDSVDSYIDSNNLLQNNLIEEFHAKFMSRLIG